MIPILAEMKYTIQFQIFQNRMEWKEEKYSETSLNQPALGPKNMASLVRWPVLQDLFCIKELFGRDLKNWQIFKEGPV
jgi:hypothetical protein